MNPKTSFTHFFKIQKTPEVQPRKEGLSIHTNAGIIYDNFEESFYGVQSESEGYTGKAPEKVIIALNKNRVTSPYQITKSYDKIEDWGSLPKVYGSNNGEGYCKTDKSVIIPLDSKLVNGEKITDRIKNNIMSNKKLQAYIDDACKKVYAQVVKKYGSKYKIDKIDNYKVYL